MQRARNHVHSEPFCTYIVRVVLYIISFYVQIDKKKIRFLKSFFQQCLLEIIVLTMQL